MLWADLCFASPPPLLDYAERLELETLAATSIQGDTATRQFPLHAAGHVATVQPVFPDGTVRRRFAGPVGRFRLLLGFGLGLLWLYHVTSFS